MAQTLANMLSLLIRWHRRCTLASQNKIRDRLACESEGTEVEFLLTEDVDKESLLTSLDKNKCFSSSDEFEEVENELDAVWNDVSF